MKHRKVKTADHSHVIGTNHNNEMANQNGLDEIDLWAMGIGTAERTKHDITPQKRHVSCV
ncbi:MAG: hypothetical protein DRP09_21060 [Candidatus Thorarchaeota archaeon]|nr:MAG: hypothetical protein DRP09_21060 [Candidatus Thorarchaeota archaeon]